jgi:hypothetical protein
MQSRTLALHPAPRLRTKPWAEPKIVDIELAYFKISKIKNRLASRALSPLRAYIANGYS